MKELRDWEGNLEKTHIEYDVLGPSEKLDKYNLHKSDDSDIPSATPKSYNKTSFTVKADKTDCLLAVGSGLLTGLLDVFWVGSLDLADSQRWGREKSDRFVILVAQSQGSKSNDLKDSIQYLEKRFKNPSDKLTNSFGGPTQHHINDLSHHPTLVGLFFSILTQFTQRAHGINSEGKYISIPLPDKAVTGKSFIEKISFGLVHWFFHLVSDMSGSSNSPGKGTGIPGPLLSFAKSVSSLRFVRELSVKYNDDYVQISLFISRIFTGVIIPYEDGQDKIRFDMRTEIGVSAFLGKQSIPVLINHALTRSFYLIKHLFTEIKNNQINNITMLNLMDPARFLPYTNDCTIRMTTISTGVFTAIDSCDATVRAALHCGFSSFALMSCVVFRLNIPGILSLAIAIRNDVRNTFYGIESTYITGDMIEFNVDVRVEMYNNELYEYTFNNLLAKLTNRRNAYMNHEKFRQDISYLIQIANSDYYTYSNLVSVAEKNVKKNLSEMFDRMLSINDISYEKVPYQIVPTISKASHQYQYPSRGSLLYLYLNGKKYLCIFDTTDAFYIGDDIISKAVNDSADIILLVSFSDPQKGTISYDIVHKNIPNDNIIINTITLRDLFDLCFGKDEFSAFLKHLNRFNKLAQKVTGFSVIRLSGKDVLHAYGDDNVIVDISFDEFLSWIDNALLYNLSAEMRSSIRKIDFSLTHTYDDYWTLSYYIEPSSSDYKDGVLSSSTNTIQWLSELSPNDIYKNVLDIINEYLSGDSRGAIILKQYSISYTYYNYETRMVKKKIIKC